MKEKTIISITKEGSDYGIKIAKGTLGRDVEIGLANAIKSIADYQRTFNPDFKTETLLEAIKGWIKCLS